MAKRKKKKKSCPLLTALKNAGNTNIMGYLLILLLAAGLAGGFYLARMSIMYQYTGALMCWTVVFTPIGTAISIVLTFIVKKSTAENTSADGEGIKYATAKANNFGVEQPSQNSPPI